jgi:hypothetical protein
VVQEVADIVSRELQLEQPFVALEFLRTELAKDAAEQGVAGDEGTSVEADAPEAASQEPAKGQEPSR